MNLRKYCINCGKKIILSATRCKSCELKRRYRNSKNHPNYIDGRTSKKNCCVDCDKRISHDAKRCRSCAKKDLFKSPKNHPMYGRSGKNSPNYGSYRNERTKKKISFKLKKLYKNPENHPTWKGGLSVYPYNHKFNNELRIQIKQRDKNICQICGVRKYGRELSIHHSDYNKYNCNVNDLFSLCSSCHSKTNFDRSYWYAYFEYSKENVR